MTPLLLAAFLQAAAPAPVASAESERLGRRLAASGTLAGMAPLLIRRDVAELAAAHPSLTPAEKERLAALGTARGEAATARLVEALGHAYAMRLPVADLRILVAQAQRPETIRWRRAMPDAAAEAMRTIGAIDVKAETAAAFCAETGKLCAGE